MGLPKMVNLGRWSTWGGGQLGEVVNLGRWSTWGGGQLGEVVNLGGFVSDIERYIKLNAEQEALRERRPPWPRQIITPIFPTVKMLSLGGEKLALQVLDHYLHHDLIMLRLLYCILLIYSS